MRHRFYERQMYDCIKQELQYYIISNYAGHIFYAVIRVGLKRIDWTNPMTPSSTLDIHICTASVRRSPHLISASYNSPKGQVMGIEIQSYANHSSGLYKFWASSLFIVNMLTLSALNTAFSASSHRIHRLSLGSCRSC